MIVDCELRIADSRRAQREVEGRNPPSAIRHPQGFLFRPALLMVLFFTGCNYHPVRWRPATGIKVPIFQNDTERRMNEFDLTDVVIRRIHAHTPYQVNRPDADLLLLGKITSHETPGRVEGRNDLVIVSEVQVDLSIQVQDLRTGQTVLHRRTLQRSSFAGGRQETEDTALAQVREKLAQWVVEQLQTPW